MNREFIDLVLFCLKDAGELNFSTDFADYGESVGELLSLDQRFENLQQQPYTHDLADYPVSKYMRRFLDLGQPIYLCRYRKKPGLEIPLPQLNKGFRLRWPSEDH